MLLGFENRPDRVTVRLLLLRSAIACLRLVYAPLKLLPRRRRVLFLTRQSDTPPLDFTLLAEEIRRLDPHSEIVMICETLGPRLVDRVRYLLTTLRQTYHLARSHVCVVDGYAIPVSVLSHRPGLTVVQMWHALGAIKRFGYQSVDTDAGRSSDLAEVMRMHANYDHVLCGGPGAIPVFAEAFGVEPARVLPLGLPRIDYLLAREHDAAAGAFPAAVTGLLDRHPSLLDSTKTRILYAPTFRRGHATRLDALADHFDSRRHVVLTKLHCLECARVEESHHIVDATGIGVLDLLAICDVVITDYSAVAFEAYSLGRPVYYYVYDIDEYRRSCGLNIDPLAAAPAVSSKDLGEIVRRIDERASDGGFAREMAERYLPHPIEGSTARIAELVLGRMRAGEDR